MQSVGLRISDDMDYILPEQRASGRICPMWWGSPTKPLPWLPNRRRWRRILRHQVKIDYFPPGFDSARLNWQSVTFVSALWGYVPATPPVSFQRRVSRARIRSRSSVRAALGRTAFRNQGLCGVKYPIAVKTTDSSVYPYGAKNVRNQSSSMFIIMIYNYLEYRPQ